MADVPPPPIARGTSPTLRPFAAVVYILFAGVVLYATWRILFPFLTPILLAAVVVTLSYDLYEKIVAAMGGRRNLGAGVMLILVTLVLVLPAALLTTLLVQQAGTLFNTLQDADFSGFFASLQVNERIATVERLIPWINLQRVQLDEMAMNLVRQIPGVVATQGGKLLTGFFSTFIGFIMMLLAAFILYTHGRTIVSELRTLSPLPDIYDEQIFEKFRGVIDATFRGQLLTGLAQGFATGVGLAISGVPGALFWGAVAAVFSLIPMVGAGAVWVPASVYLIFQASQDDIAWWRPIFLAAWGFGVVSLVDNLVRPLAMRRGANLHPIILFFSILGGLQAFGFTGIFLGPLVVALLVTAGEIYKTAFHTQIEEDTGRLIVPPREGAATETPEGAAPPPA